MRKIILASSSQTRALILKEYAVPFEQRNSDFNEENLTIKDPAKFVYHATKGKMQSFVSEDAFETPVLCADTVVTAEGKLLRKAKDVQDARRILEAQSGNSVSIITCMILKSQKKELIDLSATTYLFKEFDKEKLEAYLQSDEWKGKAGACMVEGFCKEYIKEVKGYESTAMGLCAEKLLMFLEDL
jgi:septum formation protein